MEPADSETFTDGCRGRRKPHPRRGWGGTPVLEDWL